MKITPKKHRIERIKINKILDKLSDDVNDGDVDDEYTKVIRSLSFSV